MTRLEFLKASAMAIISPAVAKLLPSHVEAEPVQSTPLPKANDQVKQGYDDLAPIDMSAYRVGLTSYFNLGLESQLYDNVSKQRVGRVRLTFWLSLA